MNLQQLYHHYWQPKTSPVPSKQTAVPSYDGEPLMDIQRNKTLLDTTTWMNLKCGAVSKSKSNPKVTPLCLHSYDILEKNQNYRSVVAKV